MNDATPISAQPRTSLAERERLLRLGLVWIDAEGQLHEGQPNAETFAEIFSVVTDAPLVRRALAAANEAARKAGDLRAALTEAEAAYLLAHEQAKIAAAAEWSRSNAAPHDRAHDQRVAEYFARRVEGQPA
jgi:hypothetical protein